jgi:hypothetical protein
MTANPDPLRVLQDQLDLLDAALNDDAPPAETFGQKLRPRGSDELVPVPDEVEMDPADVGEAWDAVMPAWVRGLLDTEDY